MYLNAWPIGNGIIRRYGLVGVGMVWLEEVCHRGGRQRGGERESERERGGGQEDNLGCCFSELYILFVETEPVMFSKQVLY